MGVTVMVPVGPSAANKRYLKECLDSIREQTVKVDEILIVDDMAHLLQDEVGDDVRIWQSPWKLGIAHAFNFGVALAENDLVVMLGSDDKLHPWCIDDLLKTYEKNKRKDGYYYFDVEYSDGGSQSVACNCAAMTKGFLKSSGGFPIESEVGACDTMLISILLANHKAGTLIRVESEKPPFWYRRHAETDTAGRTDWQGVIFTVRDLVTRYWRVPEWT